MALMLNGRRKSGSEWSLDGNEHRCHSFFIVRSMHQVPPMNETPFGVRPAVLLLARKLYLDWCRVKFAERGVLERSANHVRRRFEKSATNRKLFRSGTGRASEFMLRQSSAPGATAGRGTLWVRASSALTSALACPRAPIGLTQGKGCRKGRSRSFRQSRLTLVREEHCEPEAVSQWHLG
jgi:hypothetical protein